MLGLKIIEGNEVFYYIILGRQNCSGVQQGRGQPAEVDRQEEGQDGEAGHNQPRLGLHQDGSWWSGRGVQRNIPTSFCQSCLSTGDYGAVRLQPCQGHPSPWTSWHWQNPNG